MAGLPRCCQQRPTPRTRREQGVPFCVRAPQIETVSFGSVGSSAAATLAADEFPRGAEDEAELPFAELSEACGERLFAAMGVV